MMKKIMAVAAVSVLFATTSFAAATASASMHYGKPSLQKTAVQGSGPIVITNCSYTMANVSAQFYDGSSKVMAIYPQNNYPMNMISIDNSYPYVTIEINALDGTTLFPNQPVYPGQHVGIGCGGQKLGASTLSVAVTR